MLNFKRELMNTAPTEYDEDGNVVKQHVEYVVKSYISTDTMIDVSDMEDKAEREAEELAEYERTRPMTIDERLDMLDECIAELSTLMSDMMEG